MISDNLARMYIHDLSNERLSDVFRDRKRLVSEMQDRLCDVFDHWSPNDGSRLGARISV